MNKFVIVLLLATVGLSSCDPALFEAAPLTYKIKFVNFDTVTDGQVGFLAGGFPVSAWSTSAYPVTWTNGDSNEFVIPNFLETKKVLFRLIIGTGGSWDPPAGIDPNVLKPNAQNANGDDDYDSGDANWGFGNGDTGNGKVKPDGGFVLNGGTHSIKIDGRGGDKVAYIYIDDVLKFDGTY